MGRAGRGCALASLEAGTSPACRRRRKSGTLVRPSAGCGKRRSDGGKGRVVMMLQVENLGKDVGTETHLHDMSFQLTAASLNVLLGPTQAGKTSLLRLLAGLDRPTRGRILLNGEDITERSVRRRSVALVYQQFIHYPSLPVCESSASPLRRQRVGGRELDRRVRDTATMLGIEALLQRMPDELSGGQQQRTALARALVREADLLLVDEPLVNLDYKPREQLRDELKSILDRKSTRLNSSHVAISYAVFCLKK